MSASPDDIWDNERMQTESGQKQFLLDCSFLPIDDICAKYGIAKSTIGDWLEELTGNRRRPKAAEEFSRLYREWAGVHYAYKSLKIQLKKEGIETEQKAKQRKPIKVIPADEKPRGFIW